MIPGEARRPKAEERGEEVREVREVREEPLLPAGQISEFVVSVSAVLETTGVDQTARQCVMGVVGRLVDRLARVEEEKDSATLQLRGESETCLDSSYNPSARNVGEGVPAGEGTGGEEGGGEGRARG